MSDLVTEGLVAEFIAESHDHLEMIEPDLLHLEQERDSTSTEVIARVFRAIHSIKGGASFLSFDNLKQLSHSMENVLMLIRNGELIITTDCIDSLLQGVDILRMMLNDVAASDRISCAEEIQRLNRFLAMKRNGGVSLSAPREEKQETPNPPVTSTFNLQSDAVKSAFNQGKFVYKLTIFIHQDLQKNGVAPGEFISDLLTLGQILDSSIDLNTLPSIQSEARNEQSFHILFTTPLEKELMEIAVKLPESQIVLCEERDSQGQSSQAANEKKPIESPPPDPIPPVVSASKETKPTPAPSPNEKERSETLRVRTDLLNRLINTAGELVLSRNQLLQTMGRYRDIGADVFEILQKIDHVTTILQEEILQTRMQPIGAVFGRYPRLVRDMAHQLGKEIDIRIEGSEVELDKSIIELLSDPLNHIVRNSADHAIESPEEREKKEKPRCGQIVLKAYHEGGQVNIAVRDDGRGIDPLIVGRKAVEKRIIRQEELEKLSETEIINLICLPGFSTAEKVTDVSGRGVGMDVVRVNIERLGGHLKIESRPGEGTTVLLRLPLTLAIMPSLIVGVGGYRIAVPRVKLVELVWIYTEEFDQRIESIQKAPVLRLRSKLLPLVWFADILGVPRPSTKDSCILVLREGSDLFGVIVDELFDMEEVVVKPTSSYVKQCKFFAGACILGDGRVAMILDAGGLTQYVDLHFSEIHSEEKRRLAENYLEETRRNQNKRSVILFTIYPEEFFAVPQDAVLRLEHIQRSDIQKVGDKEFLPYQNTPLQLYRMDDILPVRPLPEEISELFLIIPKQIDPNQGTPRAQTGFIVSRVLDTMDVYDTLQEPGITGPGIVGSLVIDGYLTHFLNPMELLNNFQATGV